MAISRSALDFMERKGIVPTYRGTVPRLDIGASRVNTIPLAGSQLNPDKVRDATESVDRGRTDVWPPPQKVE